jgi:ketosteroid isomerase-like protein
LRSSNKRSSRIRKVGFSALLVLITAFVGARRLAAQDASGSTESKIIALEKAWNQAYKFRDKKALAEILGDPMVLINDDGSIQSRAAFIASLDAAPPTDDQQAEPESISVRVFGPAAIATGVFRMKGIEKGKPYAKRNRFVDTWISKNGSWVCISAVATPIVR